MPDDRSHWCCDVGPAACRLLRLQGEDCCRGCVHDRVHPQVAATGKPDSSTHFICSVGTRDNGRDITHHLVPVKNVQTCRYCGKSDAEIRKVNGLA